MNVLRWQLSDQQQKQHNTQTASQGNEQDTYEANTSEGNKNNYVIN
jgi:hypothetical protein